MEKKNEEKERNDLSGTGGGIQVTDREREIIERVSGEYYDYARTYAPERPYLHEYHKTLTMKMYMASQWGDGSYVLITFEQALEKIRQVDSITRGIPKIVYLVGWQYNGHDAKYPAWHEVNEDLKRPEDATALDSYLWLCDQALQYNTTVSVHINMTDAYEDSPLWDAYVEHGLIARNLDGSFLQIGGFGEQEKNMYQICYTKEWESGYAVRRIDYIIDMLRLDRAKTVHLDAFFARTNDYCGITMEQEMQAMRKLYRYWRDRGIDVTSEQHARLRQDPFIGLQPMSWWFDLDRKTQTRVHQNLACGGMEWPETEYNNETGFLFGQCMQGEDIFSTENYIQEFQKRFCTTTLQMYYHNLRSFEAYDEEKKTVTYSGGLVTDASDWSVREKGKLLRSGNDVFIPAAWRENQEILAFSENGYTGRTWDLPEEWKEVKSVDIYTVTGEGLMIKQRNLAVEDGKVRMSLEAMEEVSIQPAA